MSLPSDETVVWLSANTHVAVAPGTLHLFVGNQELTSGTLSLEWLELFRILIPDGLSVGELRRHHRRLQVPDSTFDATIGELIRLGVLTFARWSMEAERFHLRSSFGRFHQPYPPFPEATVDASGVAGVDGESPHIPCDPIDPLRAHSLVTALLERRSTRSFSGRPITRECLGAILWAAYSSSSGSRRTAPSAGATYPLTLYAMVARVGDARPGVYVFCPRRNWLMRCAALGVPDDLGSLFRTKHVDYRGVAAIVFITGRIDAVCQRYGERGYRYLLFEAGHVGQNVCLAAASLGIGHVPVGGFEDDACNEVLGLDTAGGSVTLYSVALGDSV